MPELKETIKKICELARAIILIVISIVATYYIAQELYKILGNSQYLKDNQTIINLDFLKGALTGLGGNLITFIVFLSISLLFFFIVNYLPRRDLINFFGITQRNTKVIILVSKVEIREQTVGRTVNPPYPGYSGSSIVKLEYNAAEKLKDKFELDRPLISFQNWFNILENSFLAFKNITVEIRSCPDEEDEIQNLFDAADEGRTSLILIGSPVNNQFVEVLFFGQCKGRSIASPFLSKIKSFMERINYSYESNTNTLMPLRFKEYPYTDQGTNEKKMKFDVRLNEDDSEEEKGQFCGFIQRMPIINQQTMRTKSTITVFAGWDDIVTDLVVEHFIKKYRSGEITTLAQKGKAFPVLLFKADDITSEIFDINGHGYRTTPFPRS